MCIRDRDWNKYIEHQTEFIKATTCPNSIYENLLKVYKMPKEERESLGKMARQWVIDGFSVEVIGKIIEDFVDNSEPANYEFEEVKEEEKKNFPDAFVENIPDDSEWILALYDKVLIFQNNRFRRYVLERFS